MVHIRGHIRGHLRWPAQAWRMHHHRPQVNKQDRRPLGCLHSTPRLANRQADQSSRSLAGYQPDQSNQSLARHQPDQLSRSLNSPLSINLSLLAKGRLLLTLQAISAMMSQLRSHQARSHPADGPTCPHPHRLGVSTGHPTDKASSLRVTLGRRTTPIRPCPGHSPLIPCPTTDSRLTALQTQ
jgi:hypothetical protein